MMLHSPSSQPLDPIRWKVVEPGKPTVYFDAWDEARQYCQAYAPKSIPEAAKPSLAPELPAPVGALLNRGDVPHLSPSHEYIEVVMTSFIRNEVIQ